MRGRAGAGGNPGLERAAAHGRGRRGLSGEAAEQEVHRVARGPAKALGSGFLNRVRKFDSAGGHSLALRSVGRQLGPILKP